MRHAFLFIIIASSLFLYTTPLSAQRETIDISAGGWELTLDRDADWENDVIEVSPVISSLPIHTPTGGWELLDSPHRRGLSDRKSTRLNSSH